MEGKKIPHNRERRANERERNETKRTSETKERNKHAKIHKHILRRQPPRNARKYQQQPKSPSNASNGKGSFFICLDEASSVCNPKELSHDSSNKARIFTIAEHAKRVKLLRAKRELRLRRVSKSDAFKEATRTYETFGLGAFATWVSTEHAISAVSDDEVTVMFCGDFCVPNLHTLDDMHSAFVRFVFFFFFSSLSSSFVMFARAEKRCTDGACENIFILCP